MTITAPLPPLVAKYRIVCEANDLFVVEWQMGTVWIIVSQHVTPDYARMYIACRADGIRAML